MTTHKEWFAAAMEEPWFSRFMQADINYTPPGLWLDPNSNVIAADTSTASNAKRYGMTMPKVKARRTSSSAPQTTQATQP